MMTLEDFTGKIEEQFMEGTVKLTPETDFRDNDEFDSLVGMAMLVVMKENFGYEMSVPEYLECHTTADLYARITK